MVVVVVVVALAGTLTVVAANRDKTPLSVTGPSDGTIRMTRWYREGPFAEYGLDYGSIGLAPPASLTLPSGTYDVVLTLSFDLRTSENDSFVVSVRGDDGEVAVVPRERAVAGTGSADSTTVAFRVRGLAGGATYNFVPGVNAGERIGRARIATERMLLVIDATPAA